MANDSLARRGDDEPVSGRLSLAAMIERVVTDPSVDVSKLEKVIALHERGMARIAEQQFDAAMSRAQQEIRPVAADAYNPQTKSKYASYEQLDGALRPVYTTHGFGLSFNTAESGAVDVVRVCCDVTHTGGHSKPYRIDMPADGKGAKGGDVMTRTHATGAAVSYGMRYLLKMIFNVAVGDGDGNSASAKPAKPATPEPPANYASAMLDLAATADNGQKAFGEACRALPKALLVYALTHDRPRMEGMKATAQLADKKAAQ